MDAALFSSPTWFYIDSDGHERGPFRAADMLGWYSDGYFPSHLLVRPNIHSNFIALSSLALGYPVEPIQSVDSRQPTLVNVHPEEKSPKSEEAKSSEMSRREIKEEYVEREIKEECIKTEIKVECLKPEIKKKYIEPEIRKEWLKLESEEECIKTEIKEECIKLESKDGYIKLDGKEGCIKLKGRGDFNFIQLKYKLEGECGNTLPLEIHSSPGADVVDMDARGGAKVGTHSHQSGQVPTSLRPLLIPPPPPDAYSAFRPITEYQGDKKRKLAMERKTQRKKRKECERVIEKDTNNLPTFKVNHATVCSTTLWIGHLSKHVEKEDLSTLFRVYGEVNSINLIRPMGCAYVEMKRRTDAEKALEKLRLFRLDGKRIKIGWAPGKRVKDMEWKEYFDYDLGTFFIPLDKLDSWLNLSMVD